MINIISKKNMLLLLFIIAIINSAFCQSKNVEIPDIPGYYTLKCDFHLHTVFSDGHVWPTLRVNEAIRDGLDVISITDHIDYEGFPEIIQKDYNKPFEIAKSYAENKELIVINGGEISPRVSPYHNNAIFLKDVNKLPIDYMEKTKKEFVMKDKIKDEELMAPFIEAKKQEAFVFYNHPGWPRENNDTTLFTSFHKKLLEKGLLDGVEIVNSGVYNMLAHKIAEEYNLTMLGNSDEHHDIYFKYKESHRPMTLVFVEEKSETGIKNALIEKRTAVLVDDFIIARQPEAEQIFKASVDLVHEKSTKRDIPLLLLTFTNKSDIPFRIRVKSDYNIVNCPLGETILNPHEPNTITLWGLWEFPSELNLEMEVLNIVVSPEKHLETNYQLSSLKQNQ
ncbi:MAG: Sb-PDE family phosphodiesterase [Cyclobacteriaceae bacterium]